MYVCSPVFLFLGFFKAKIRKTTRRPRSTPGINAQDTQDAQDPPHPQDPPYWKDPWDSRYAKNARDVKAAGDTGDYLDPQEPWDLRNAQELRELRYSWDAWDTQDTQDTGEPKYPQEDRRFWTLIPPLRTEGGNSCPQLWVPIIIKNYICVCCR